MSDIRIKRATAAHIERIKKLDKEFLGRDDVSDNEMFWVGTNVNDDVVCYAGMAQSWSDSRAMYLSSAAVLPKYRSQGLHTRLIRARLKFAKKLGYERVITYALSGNFASLNNLIKLGFRLYRPKTWGGTVLEDSETQFTYLLKTL
jgi:ribosomal protein S18 acetylase RimI-like enzyme